MCAGRLVELAPSGELFRNPMHPYTKALLSAVPMPDPDAAPRSARADGGQGVRSVGLAGAVHRRPAASRSSGPRRRPAIMCALRGKASDMLHYVARRILLMIPTLFVISALVYFIIDLPPGDCVTSQIDELLSRGDPDALRRADELRQLYGLDQPLWHRYFALGRAASSAGTSGCRCQDTVPVADLIGERLALTIVMETCHHRLHLDRVVRHRRLCRDPSVQARRLRRLVHRLRRARRSRTSCWRWCCSMSARSISACRSAA